MCTCQLCVYWPAHIGDFSEASDFIGSEAKYLGTYIHIGYFPSDFYILSVCLQKSLA